MNQGTLAILRGSHRFGVLPLEFHMGPGNRQAVVPAEMREGLRWVTTDMDAGDVLIFGSLTVHAALHNATRTCASRSTSATSPRAQRAHRPRPEPHFERLTWEEIYAGWKSEEHQYYWRDLDYELVHSTRSRSRRAHRAEMRSSKCSCSTRLAARRRGVGLLRNPPELWVLNR